MENGKVALALNTFFLRAILKYANYPSISAIRKYNRTHHQFFFSVVGKENIIKELQKLNPKKVTQETDITVKILKDKKHIFAETFQMFFNDAIILLCKFLSSLKLAYLQAVFKKGTKCNDRKLQTYQYLTFGLEDFGDNFL